MVSIWSSLRSHRVPSISLRIPPTKLVCGRIALERKRVKRRSKIKDKEIRPYTTTGVYIAPKT